MPGTSYALTYNKVEPTAYMRRLHGPSAHPGGARGTRPRQNLALPTTAPPPRIPGVESVAAAPDSVSCRGSSRPAEAGHHRAVGTPWSASARSGRSEGTSHNCRCDWAPSMSTGPGIDAIGRQITTDEIDNVAAKLIRNPSSAIGQNLSRHVLKDLAVQVWRKPFVAFFLC
jgi:hypothetical protein